MWDESTPTSPHPPERWTETNASIVGARPQRLGGFLRHLNAASRLPAAVIDGCADQSWAWWTQPSTDFPFPQVFPVFFVSAVAVTGRLGGVKGHSTVLFHSFIVSLFPLCLKNCMNI